MARPTRDNPVNALARAYRSQLTRAARATGWVMAIRVDR